MKKEKSSGKEMIDSISQTLRHRQWDFDLMLPRKKKIHVDKLTIKVPSFLLAKIKNPKLLKALQKSTIIYLNNEIPGTILDTLDVLYKNKPCPKFKSKWQNAHGWTLSFRMVPGTSFSDIEKKEEYLADSSGCSIKTTKQGNMAFVHIFTSQLKKRYPYEFNPNEYTKMFLPLPIGHSHTGFIVQDLATFPHMLIAGVTGSGKGNSARVFLVALVSIEDKPACPAPYTFMLDPKRGVDYAHFNNHICMIKDPSEFGGFLKKTLVEMNKRLELIFGKAENIYIYNKKHPKNQIPPIVIFVDELASIEGDEKTIGVMKELVRVGRAAGIHMILCTQRPSANIFEEFSNIRSQLSGRLSFKMESAIDSVMMLGAGNHKAFALPSQSENPGRAIFQL